MITLNDLAWSKIEGDAPEMSCNLCGKTAPAQDWHIGTINLSDDATFSVVLCSDECLHGFKSHPSVTSYINDRLRAVQRLQAKGNG
jgi:hypothetical protein